MTGFLQSLLAIPERTGRRLHRDAVAVIHADQRKGATETLQRTADLTRDELTNLESRLTDNPNDRDGLLYAVRQRHQNARRRDNALFTATTLVLIYARAKQLGEPGQAAIDTIDNFISNPLLQDDDDDTSGTFKA